MMITPELLKARTKKFAIEVILSVEDLPYKTSTNIITKQLIRAVTSVGAIYRSACRQDQKLTLFLKLQSLKKKLKNLLLSLPPVAKPPNQLNIK